MQQISEQLRVLRHSHSCRMILLGDFNIDQRLETNINRFAAIKQTHKMEQKTKYNTHVDGGILDLIFDNNLTCNNMKYIPTPYSDHYIVLYSM